MHRSPHTHLLHLTIRKYLLASTKPSARTFIDTFHHKLSLVLTQPLGWRRMSSQSSFHNPHPHSRHTPTTTSTASAPSPHSQHSPSFTHFICVPLFDKVFRRSYQRFLGLNWDTLTNSDVGLDKSVILPSNRLHLTCLLLSLSTQAEIDRAVNVFQNESDAIRSIIYSNSRTKSCPELEMRGFQIMNENPRKANVAYVPPVSKNTLSRLEQVTRHLALAFSSAGLLPLEVLKRQRIFKDPSNLETSPICTKWHMTVLNTKYRKSKKRFPFDATEVLQAGSQYSFGCAKVQTIELSDMSISGSFDPNDFFYPSVATIQIDQL